MNQDNHEGRKEVPVLGNRCPYLFRRLLFRKNWRVFQGVISSDKFLMFTRKSSMDLNVLIEEFGSRDPQSLIIQKIKSLVDCKYNNFDTLVTLS